MNVCRICVYKYCITIQLVFFNTIAFYKYFKLLKDLR